ncbi:MAG: hypothetical protein JXR25_14375 [Pontiellaceae bacterium]|nr:hypothetical protein [Pontiellaceae bacterium]
MNRGSRARLSLQRIWIGRDHLLLIRASGWNEVYRRFYFEDIQSFTMIWSRGYVIWGILLPLLALILFAMVWSWGARIAAGITGGVFLMLWMVHLLKGRTCKCWLQTGINNERLHMLKRVSHARKFWEQVEPLLIAAQGDFSLEEMDAVGMFPDRKMRPVPPAVPRVDDPNAGAEGASDETAVVN